MLLIEIFMYFAAQFIAPRVDGDNVERFMKVLAYAIKRHKMFSLIWSLPPLLNVRFGNSKWTYFSLALSFMQS